MSAPVIFRKLREQGILVRYFDKPRINDYLRITIGTDTEMEALLQAMMQILPETDIL
ncbi:histidinol-phosphate aminotransferase [compost metagenome]